MKLKVNTEELVKSKMTRTLAIIEGYYREAQGDLSINQSYSANAVYRRMNDIRVAIYTDIHNLAKDISE